MVLTMNSLISSANGSMPLHWLFPTPVMQVDLTPDDGIAAGMHQQLEVFDRDSLVILSFPIATTSPEIFWGLLAWISCIGWRLSSGSITRSQSRCRFI